MAGLAIQTGGFFHKKIAPLAGAGSKPLFEAGVEKTQMIEAALFCNIDDFGLGIPQAGRRLHQAHFHLHRRNRTPKTLLRQTTEMTPATTKLRRQFGNRKIQQLIRRKVFKHLHNAVFCAHKTGALAMRRLEFLRENGGGNAQ